MENWTLDNIDIARDRERERNRARETERDKTERDSERERKKDNEEKKRVRQRQKERDITGSNKCKQQTSRQCHGKTVSKVHLEEESVAG